MDTSIKTQEATPERKIVAWKCSTDGKHFVEFSEKRCKYCVPVYEDGK